MNSYFSPFDFYKRIFIITFAIFVLILAVWQQYTTKYEVTLKEKVFSVEVTDTQDELEEGLSGHKPLLDNEGMFFIFDNVGIHGFWMKDMLFPIDIIWIDQDFKIIHIEELVTPDTYPKVFYPGSPSMYVLEVKAGVIDELDLKLGESVKFSKK